MKSAFLAFVLLLLACVAYSNSFHNSFHFDDSHTIQNNLYIRSIGNIPLFFRDSTTFSSLPSNRSYRPVVTATLAIDYWLGEGLGDTFYFHLSMFVFFALQALLMLFLYRRVFRFADPAQAHTASAALAAGWYLVHPANAETINYIISRSDSYSALCIVLCFVLYGGSRLCRRWHVYLIPLAVGMLTKPIAFIFPVLLLWYIFLFEERGSLAGLFSRQGLAGFRSALKKTAPAFLFTLAMLVLIQQMEPPTWSPGGSSPLQYVLTQPYVILKYFISFFLPVALSADTDLGLLPSVFDIRFFAGILFLLLLFAATVFASERPKLTPIAFGLLWFIFTLLPTSLIPLAEVMNDHRVFLPYIGLTLSAAWSAYLLIDFFRVRFGCGKAIAMACICLLLAGSAYGTYQRNEVWRTEETLWKDVTEKSPANGRGLMNYGLVLMARGDYAGAEKYFLKALELTPNYATLEINLGVLNDATGNPGQAEPHFKKAIALRPDYPEVYFYYARFLHKHRRLDEAQENLKKSISLSFANMDARHLLMRVYQDLGDERQAAELARQTLAIAPDDKQALKLLISGAGGANDGAAAAETPESYLNMSLAQYRAREFARCIESARKALQLRPGYGPAYNNLCAAYNELRQWDLAIEAGEQAVRLDPDSQLAKNNLAWAKRERAAAKSTDSASQNR